MDEDEADIYGLGGVESNQIPTFVPLINVAIKVWTFKVTSQQISVSVLLKVYLLAPI